MHQILSKALLLKVHCNLCLLYAIMNSNCCYHIVLKNASLYFTCETIYLFCNKIIIKPDIKNKYHYELKQRSTYILSCSSLSFFRFKSSVCRLLWKSFSNGMITTCRQGYPSSTQVAMNKASEFAISNTTEESVTEDHKI